MEECPAKEEKQREGEEEEEALFEISAEIETTKMAIEL